MRYPKQYAKTDGWTTWIQPRMAGYRMACCDCGLVHEMQFRVIRWGRGFKAVFRARRNNRSTAAIRRQHRWPRRGSA